MSQARPPPVVFLGPSAPPDAASSILPDALVRPPARRGDLYHYRLLKHSLFVIIDGVFANRLAISPREVVEVLKDGAMVIGASSMGALRAADCAPAGAIGKGLIYRLYRRRAISSEDEVAVAYQEERPYPPLTVPLVNVRIALRRAASRQLITPQDAMRIVRAAERQSYHERMWSSLIERANVRLSKKAEDYLQAIDAKREDACSTFRWIAVRSVQDDRFGGAPRSRPNVFGLLGNGRERPPDPWDGVDQDEHMTDFLAWMVLSGAVTHMGFSDSTLGTIRGQFETGFGKRCLERLWRAANKSAEFDALVMRFSVFRRAVIEARRLRCRPDLRDIALAELELADAHGVLTWSDLIGGVGKLQNYGRRLCEHRDMLALAKSLRRNLNSTADTGGIERREVALWRRS